MNDQDETIPTDEGVVNIYYAAGVMGVNPQTLRRNITHKGKPLTLENLGRYAAKRKTERDACQKVIDGYERLCRELAEEEPIAKSRQ